jgi:hypothetical protein
MQKLQVNTEDSKFSSRQKEESKFNTQIIKHRNKIRMTYDSPYIEVPFRGSNRVQAYTKEYPKIFQLCSDLGGMFEILSVFSACVYGFYNYYWLRKMLVRDG